MNFLSFNAAWYEDFPSEWIVPTSEMRHGFCRG